MIFEHHVVKYAFQWNINIDFCFKSIKKKRSKCNAYSAYRMEEHTKSLIKKKKNVLISRKIKTGAAIKHHWAIIEWACNVAQGPWSRKENVLAILVAGANRRNKQVNCVK